MKGIRRVELVEVIKTRTVIGNGSKEDPVREVIQYWDKTGRKIAEKDDYDERKGRKECSKISGKGSAEKI